MSISPEGFVNLLEAAGIRHVFGVPCSLLSSGITALISSERLSYLSVANEGIAMSMACGAVLGGGRASVLLQDSGLGNLINPLTSLGLTYGIPVLIVVSRHKPTDEPQHRAMSGLTDALIGQLGLLHFVLRHGEVVDIGSLSRQIGKALSDRASVVLSVERHAITPIGLASGHQSPLQVSKQHRLPSRQNILASALELSSPVGASIVASTGLIARDLYDLAPSPRHFCMVGSMGHASAIALGLSVAGVTAPLIVLDGDGALLMHLGALAAIGSQRPSRLIHVVLANGTYETTGGQGTDAGTVSFTRFGSAAGYATAAQAKSQRRFERLLSRALAEPGPHMIVARTRQHSPTSAASVMSKIEPMRIAAEFARALGDKLGDPDIAPEVLEQISTETVLAQAVV